MWNNYFKQIQDKYSMRTSLKNPLVIRLDGKDVTSNGKNDLLNEYENSFLKCLKDTTKFFSKKYKCLAILGSDEVSFIFLKPLILLEDLDNEKYNRTNEIISVFSQYFFNHFNNLYTNELIFWHGKCFTINKNKVNSYIKFRSTIIKNVVTAQFLKKMNIKDAGRMKLEERINKCNEYSGYEKIRKIQDGIMYLEGERINIKEFLNGNIITIKEEPIKEEKYFDITKWDVE